MWDKVKKLHVLRKLFGKLYRKDSNSRLGITRAPG
ncbi:uncharacterized protein J3R85_014880 [Psidium guajava]|nr:uncharacterized protein J3R85_014880 [Psidium guajava]